MPTHVTVNIRTCEADLQFQIVSKAIGSVLFDLVCKTLGIQEVWYFGLYFIDSKGFISWLDYDIMITNQVISTSSELELYFGVKFYPEDVAEDLIQEQTLHYFYLEVVCYKLLYTVNSIIFLSYVAARYICLYVFGIICWCR